ncbi:hypothetical protein EFA46_005680 [Halarchaeum sp. CBA1220]|uniref:DUF7266 family protein n=1 Tax=Halarchaeum sp. CBA1220 TaxID=1853682 RepID=UPI000F3A95E0|nr:hypothetical protein [Halarchaeum sp. CBA1220]QLC33709.1 hypothetical protein EFA46_005680 [Halarchaeum sp. CBA1220]
MTDRGMTPVVAKTLEIGIVLLYVALVTAALYGGVVPSAQADAAHVVGDRTLNAAATSVEDAVPGVAADAVTVRARVALPDTIGGQPYALRAEDRTLVLDSPVTGVGGRAALSLPERVAGVSGEWHSGRDLLVVVTGGDALSVELREVGR